MATTYKTVNIYSGSHPGPIVGLKDYPVPIIGKVHAIKLSTEDIRTCILAKAVVEEVIGTNQTVRLNLFNYNTDNSIKTSTTTTTNTVAATTAASTTAAKTASTTVTATPASTTTASTTAAKTATTTTATPASTTTASTTAAKTATTSTTASTTTSK